ncbi:unnamed protein product [Danaus chrysippus]|uniref:(African queen) hypothetical protein n=1 Tax=Danaus chrysippus TaxID=151541 RepID=A0A8J2Q0U8_9NEOP|nr:unnamed protein product [Danaus chrysippus]
MNFSRFLDIQSWWEVPSIAYFCSLFRTAFNLLDFDIEELEEALLTDGTEESASSLLTELIVRLLNGCLGNNDISAFNFQMYLRRLFRQKCQEKGKCNPFDNDINFQFLPLRTKVEILYSLCDFRLDAEDVYDLFRNLEAESLRVEPLGWDDNDSAYWYFYGTRLYREDIVKKPKPKNKKKKKYGKKRGIFYRDDNPNDVSTRRVWQVVCFTEGDWTQLTDKFRRANSKVEKELYHSLSENFLPEIPHLFQEKERLQRQRLLELAPRRTSSRVLQKIKQKEEETKNLYDTKRETNKKSTSAAREHRARRRNQLRSKSSSSESTDSSTEREVMPQKNSKQPKAKKSKNSSATQKGEPPPEPVVRTGRKTNNSLSAATGQIVIPDNDEPVNSTRKKLKTSQIQTDEDVQTDMYKVLEQLTAHDDAWPFMDPVEEEYAPNYYAVIRRPMDLRKMEERLDNGYYTDFSMFKADFKLIVNNCRLYNGQDNEYTTMVDNLQVAFDKLTEKYIHRVSSSDEEIAVEYQLPTPSRKHKIKMSESPSRQKRKKRKSNSDSGDPKSSTSEQKRDEEDDEEVAPKAKAESSRSKRDQEDQPKPELEQTQNEPVIKKNKESHKNKHDKKKRKGHHRHGKHHKKNSHKSSHDSKRHSKKQKHGKTKKSKQKKKKNRHHDVEAPEALNRSASQESLESSSRSRSASPLPSIHTPSPSPTELDKPETSTVTRATEKFTNADFLRDKYDNIKERRRHAARDAWESLFDFKQKSDLDKPTVQVSEKEKNQKLRETIERLKASNEKYKDTSLFNCLFSPRSTGERLRRLHREAKLAEASKAQASGRATSSDDEDDDDDDDDDDDEDEDENEEENEANDEEDSSEDEAVMPVKETQVKKGKKSTAKNACASEALEQAVKDISKWLDDAPKASTTSSPSDSPAQTISTEDQENSRMDDESSQGEKPATSRKEPSRKRPSSREPKTVKRREVQRTIDRLQPGKSKGNLLTNSNKNNEKAEDITPSGQLNKTRDSTKGEESSPKLSLGSVLPTVEFALGNDHNLIKDKTETVLPKESKDIEEPKKEIKDVEEQVEKKAEHKVETPTKKDAEVETEPQPIMKPSQEKATPNLSAWFKAFGAPKTITSTTASNNIKKKNEENDTDEKPTENTSNENKTSPKKLTTKYDSSTNPNSPNPEGGDSPLPNVSATPRQRRTSTGSTISERSSFSQDLDSPRHQMSHTSPLLQSPASPRTDDFQKITYPIINGTVRAGFYQDTTSLKSSPEKSCSPRDAPQSPYSPYSQHVYASNSNSSTPNYFVDHNKSPLPTYGQNAPPYYDTSKAPVVSKPPRVHEDYTALGPDSYQQNTYNGPFSPTPSPFPPTQSNYSQPQVSPQPTLPMTQPINDVQLLSDTKATLFPVKKRTYNEPENSIMSPKMLDKDIVQSVPVKNDYSKITQSIHTTPSMVSTPIDDIPVTNNIRDKNKTLDYSERNVTDTRDNITFESHDLALNHKKEIVNVDLTKPAHNVKKDNIDMINMGYMNLVEDRKLNQSPDVEFVGETKCNVTTQQKGYEIEAIAINLGMNNQQLPKSVAKPMFPMGVTNIPPAHIHERPQTDMHLNQTIPLAHHNQYDALPTGQTNNFSLNDIELANKKLYACSNTPTPTALDYGNWKMNPIRKPELMPSDYSTNSYPTANGDKLKAVETASPAAINYNKSFQHQQYNNYNNVPRSSLPRPQEAHQNISTELIIPNPRSHLKVDSSNTATTTSDSNTLSKTMEQHAKPQKSEKHIQNHPLVSSIPYKTPYTAHSSIPLDTLRNLPNMSQMLERYTNDERYLASFANSTSTLYHDKTFQMAQMFNKTMASDAHPSSTPISVYSQPPIHVANKDNGIYKSTTTMASPQTDTKKKRKRSSDTKLPSPQLGLSYHPTSSSDVLTSVKSNMMPFNFGTGTNMALSSMYGDNGGFSIEGFRNSTNQLMAANYVAAAVAHQHRTNDTNAEKLVKPAHQNSNHTSSYPFIGHAQVRSAYPFVGSEQSSPLYQQYLARYQEELQRQTGAQIMSLYPAAYTAPLSVRQPYDAINRPSWL